MVQPHSISPLNNLKSALQSPIILDFSEKTRFSKFFCLPGCKQCCGYSYFLPAEVINLPNNITKKLTLKKDGKYDIARLNGRCIFYNSDNELFCSIYNCRPLRCKIFPYFPLIVDQRIVITLEPALKMKNESTQVKTCPGVGKSGKPLKASIANCLSFLKKLTDVPTLLSTVVITSEVFNRIRNDRWFIENWNDTKEIQNRRENLK
ncbi:MAG: YkgJ family cysteine cluster protein [Promethearchaeota archaeon]